MSSPRAEHGWIISQFVCVPVNIAQDAVVQEHAVSPCGPKALSVCSSTRFLLAQLSSPSRFLLMAALHPTGPPECGVISTAEGRLVLHLSQVTDTDFKYASPMIDPRGALVLISLQDTVQLLNHCHLQPTVQTVFVPIWLF